MPFWFLPYLFAYFGRKRSWNTLFRCHNFIYSHPLPREFWFAKSFLFLKKCTLSYLFFNSVWCRGKSRKIHAQKCSKNIRIYVAIMCQEIIATCLQFLFFFCFLLLWKSKQGLFGPKHLATISPYCVKFFALKNCKKSRTLEKKHKSLAKEYFY